MQENLPDMSPYTYTIVLRVNHFKLRVLRKMIMPIKGARCNEGSREGELKILVCLSYIHIYNFFSVLSMDQNLTELMEGGPLGKAGN